MEAAEISTDTRILEVLVVHTLVLHHQHLISRRASRAVALHRNLEAIILLVSNLEAILRDLNTGSNPDTAQIHSMEDSNRSRSMASSNSQVNMVDLERTVAHSRIPIINHLHQTSSTDSTTTINIHLRRLKDKASNNMDNKAAMGRLKVTPVLLRKVSTGSRRMRTVSNHSHRHQHTTNMVKVSMANNKVVMDSNLILLRLRPRSCMDSHSSTRPLILMLDNSKVEGMEGSLQAIQDSSNILSRPTLGGEAINLFELIWMRYEF